MSRAFEILERVQQDRDLFRVPPITRSEPANCEVISPGTSRDDWAAFGREQVLRLVQTLFVTPETAGSSLPRRIVFCGIDAEDSGRLLCARIGRVLAEQVAAPVCVVDGNLRTPGANPLFDQTAFDPLVSPSFSNCGTDHGSATVITDNLSLASYDSPSTSTPTLDELRAWILDLATQFKHLVISAPPVGLYSYASIFGQMADGVVLVLEANSTRRITAQKAKQALEDAHVRVLGTVLNNRTFPVPEKLYRML